MNNALKSPPLSFSKQNMPPRSNTDKLHLALGRVGTETVGQSNAAEIMDTCSRSAQAMIDILEGEESVSQATVDAALKIFALKVTLPSVTNLQSLLKKALYQALTRPREQKPQRRGPGRPPKRTTPAPKKRPVTEVEQEAEGLKPRMLEIMATILVDWNNCHTTTEDGHVNNANIKKADNIPEALKTLLKFGPFVESLVAKDEQIQGDQDWITEAGERMGDKPLSQEPHRLAAVKAMCELFKNMPAGKVKSFFAFTKAPHYRKPDNSEWPDELRKAYAAINRDILPEETDK